MKKYCLMLYLLLFFVLFLESCSMAADWHMQLGASYESGLQDMRHIIEDNTYAKTGEDGKLYCQGWYVPATFQPYVQIKNGVRIGLSIGQLKGENQEDLSFYILPLNVNAELSFLPSSNHSPYIRLGMSYQLAGGDYIESSAPGLLAGIGCDFKRNSPVGYALELTYDNSEIEFENYGTSSSKKISPEKYSLSFFVRF